jgi:hypothetical protein
MAFKKDFVTQNSEVHLPSIFLNHHVKKHCHKKKGFKRFKYTFANPNSSNLNQTDVSSIISKKTQT